MRSFGVLFMALALFINGAVAAALPAPVRAAAAPLKAVIIVGPAGDLTAQDLEDAESLAVLAENLRHGCAARLPPARDVGKRHGQHPGREPRLLRRPRIWLAERLHRHVDREPAERRRAQLVRRQQCQPVHLLRRERDPRELGACPERTRVPQPRLLHGRQRRAGHGHTGLGRRAAARRQLCRWLPGRRRQSGLRLLRPEASTRRSSSSSRPT